MQSFNTERIATLLTTSRLRKYAGDKIGLSIMPHIAAVHVNGEMVT